MFQRIKIKSLEDYFLNLSQRNGNNVFFYKINSYSEEINNFLCRYYNETRKNGVIIDERIPNVTQNQLSYYYEMMGENFIMDNQFIMTSLQKWLPRMNVIQRKEISNAMYDVLSELVSKGKNINIIKNAYIKFMCWLYYKFESLTSHLGEQNLPKILCNGIGSHYEFMLLSILSKCGCDVLLIHNPKNQQFEPNDNDIDIWICNGMDFPEDFSIKKLQQTVSEKNNTENVCGSKPSLNIITNYQTNGNGLEDALIPSNERGNTSDTIYNICYCINGVYSRADYVNELISLKNSLNKQKRNLIIVNSQIDEPSYDEISEIKRNNYSSKSMAIGELARNIVINNNKLQQMMRYEFLDVMSKYPDDSSLNKFINACVYVLCWLKRWQKQLFSDFNVNNIPCFIFFNCNFNDNNAFFTEILSRLPIDVLILNPSNKNIYHTNSINIMDFTYDSSLEINNFPEEGISMRAGTVAYHAERELDTLMYQDTGIYRNHQYSKASSIVLDTMFEEIELLWNQELKYRPNFSTENDKVMIPVFFAKVSGVKDGNVKAYWQFVKRLVTEDTIVINGNKRGLTNSGSSNANPYSGRNMNRSLGSLNPYSLNNANPYSANSVSIQNANTSQSAVAFWKNGLLQRNAIKNSPEYPYKVLREEIQDYILDKLQLLIDSKIIKGTFENGMEYKIISTILNLDSIDKEIIRKLQNFDFTKKNPKILYINTSDSTISIEMAIAMEFLSMTGFDILFIIPTGYYNVENHYSHPIISEHQAGEYMYDLKYPDLAGIRQSWHKKLFGRN